MFGIILGLCFVCAFPVHVILSCSSALGRGIWTGRQGAMARSFFLSLLCDFSNTRNDTKHRQLPISGETVRFQILSYMRLADSALIIYPKHWLNISQTVRSIVARIGHIKTTIVRWLRPSSGCFKLNVDGSSRGNPGDSTVGELFEILQAILFYLSASSLELGQYSSKTFGGLEGSSYLLRP